MSRPSRSQPPAPEVVPQSLPPKWLGLAKAAVVIMTSLIVLGLGLLIYGFAVGLHELGRDASEQTLTYPADLTPIGVSTTNTGAITVLFQSPEGFYEAITIDSESGAIIGRLRLNPDANISDFGLD